MRIITWSRVLQHGFKGAWLRIPTVSFLAAVFIIQIFSLLIFTQQHIPPLSTDDRKKLCQAWPQKYPNMCMSVIFGHYACRNFDRKILWFYTRNKINQQVEEAFAQNFRIPIPVSRPVLKIHLQLKDKYSVRRVFKKGTQQVGCYI